MSARKNLRLFGRCAQQQSNKLYSLLHRFTLLPGYKRFFYRSLPKKCYLCMNLFCYLCSEPAPASFTEAVGANGRASGTRGTQSATAVSRVCSCSVEIVLERS